VKLAAGTNAQTVLPFSGLLLPFSVAADTAGTVYVVDAASGTAMTHGACCASPRVLSLSAGSNAQTVLPIKDLDTPTGMAVDSVGNLYIVDRNHNRVVQYIPASNTQSVLPITGLKSPADVAVDSAGTVYVSDQDRQQVVELTQH
jgi:DNA-binding beta-propeller fold protein YncE